MDGEVVTGADVAPTTLVRSRKLHGITATCNRCTAYLRRKWAEPEERCCMRVGVGGRVNADVASQACSGIEDE